MKKFISKTYIVLVFIFIYAPIAVLIAFSFNNSKSRSVWHGFTLKWYVELFKDEAIMNALLITLAVSLLAALFATILGTMAALGFSSMRRMMRNTLMQVNNIPMLNPDIVTGVSLMLLFVFVGSLFGWTGLNFGTLLCAHITFNIPYVILNVMPRIRKFDNALYDAALDLGCSNSQAFFKVMLPELLPGMISGAIMAFSLSFDDFVISFFTSGSTSQTLSLVIYAMTRKRISPKINALSTIMFVVVFVLLIGINIAQAKQNKHEKASRKAKLKTKRGAAL